MGLGQTMLTMAFFIVLCIMFINAYRVLNNADQQLLTATAYKTATDLGQSLMTEILTKKYDQNYTAGTAPSPATSQTFLNSFTAPGSLGPEGASESITLPDQSPFQSISKYNDVDDYNHYYRLTDSTNGLGRFRDSVLVYYVQMTNPPTSYNSRWWTKRIEVWVTNDVWLTNKWVKQYSIVGASTR